MNKFEFNDRPVDRPIRRMLEKPEPFSISDVPLDLRAVPDVNPPSEPLPDTEPASEDDPFFDPLMRPPELGQAGKLYRAEAAAEEAKTPQLAAPEIPAAPEAVTKKDAGLALGGKAVAKAMADEPKGGTPGDGAGEVEDPGPPVSRLEVSERPDAAALDKEPVRPPVREPQTKITGQFEVTSDIRDRAESIFRSPEARQPFDGQTEMTGELWHEILQLRGAVIEVAEEAGVHVVDRFLRPPEHHIFSSREDFSEAMRQTAGGEEPAPNLVGRWNPYGLFVFNSDDRIERDSSVLHETIHSVARREYEGERASENNEAGEPVVRIAGAHVGYHKIMFEHGEFSGRTRDAIDEMVTELATVHAATKHTDMEVKPYGYVDFVVTGFELIEGTAKLHGEAPMEILRQLERGLFTDDETGLEKLAAYMGEENFNRLATLPSAARDLHLILEMPEATRRMEAVSAGEEFRPSWLLDA